MPYDSEKLKPAYDIRLDKMNGTEFESYKKKYDETYLLDGQLLFRRDKYQQTKNKTPGADDMSIYKIIDNEWNGFTNEQKELWNTRAEKEGNKNNRDYNPDNFPNYRPHATPNYHTSSSKYSNNGPCPVNETKQSFKLKTGLDCYEICPPGKENNSTGLCVRPCEDGKERKMINGICENI